jgi:hypothetical protein
MDDSVFSAQFLAMHDAFAGQGIRIEVAYTPVGRADYIYEAGRLLARASVAGRVLKALPGARRIKEPTFRGARSLTLLSIDDLQEGYLTVPQALDVIDTRLEIHGPAPDGFPLVTPVHILHIADTVRTCPATEPEVPGCCSPGEPPAPCPPPAPAGGAGVVIGVCDSGLLPTAGAGQWLAGATGQADPLGPQLPSGRRAIPVYCGHGTFVAGVACTQAPEASVYVTRDFTMAGGQREWVIAQGLQELVSRKPAPQLVNLSAGSYTRNEWPLLSFSAFAGGGITLVAAAGNDATHRKFYPAAFDWAVAVGALGADQLNRAWFSNYGHWVDVYTLGEGLVNAFAVGEYTYQEPPKRPATAVFDGLARWSGTSFAAPMMAGLIATQMTSAGASAADATQTLLEQARQQAIPGVGPVLFPWRP